MFEEDVLALAGELTTLARRIASAVAAGCPDGVAAAVFTELGAAHRQVELAQCLAAERVDRSGVWQDGAASTTAHLRTSTGQSSNWIALRLRTGRALVDRLPATRAAWAAGALSLEHARIIAAAVEDLDDELCAEIDTVLARATPTLTVPDLRKLAEHIRQAAAPEEGQERDRQRFAAQGFTVSPTLGGFRLTGWLNEENGALLRRALEAFTPLPDATVSPEVLQQPAPSPKLRRALGLTEMARQALSHQSRDSPGPARPTIVLTLPYDDFRARYGAADVEGGATVSATAARRLACDAGVLPMQLDGDGVPVELGRSRRLASRAQRLVLNQRDKGCVFPGCDRPPGWCDAHHLVEWADGGKTDTDNLVLLCHRHHHLLHEGGWRYSGNAGKDLRFHPPDRAVRRM